MNMLPGIYHRVQATLEGAVARDSLVLVRGFERPSLIGEHIISV